MCLRSLSRSSCDDWPQRRPRQLQSRSWQAPPPLCWRQAGGQEPCNHCDQCQRVDPRLRGADEKARLSCPKSVQLLCMRASQTAPRPDQFGSISAASSTSWHPNTRSSGRGGAPCRFGFGSYIWTLCEGGDLEANLDLDLDRGEQRASCQLPVDCRLLAHICARNRLNRTVIGGSEIFGPGGLIFDSLHWPPQAS